jgi:hypothetical protein
MSQTVSNPPRAMGDLSQATITKAYWRDALPPEMRKIDGGRGGDLYIELQHHGKGPYYIAMRGFMMETDREFILRPASGPDLHLTSDIGTFSNTRNDPGHFEDRTFVKLRLHPDEHAKPRHGSQYTLIPLNHSRHTWRSDAPIRVWIP